MNEHAIRALLGEVRAGRVSRRAFVRSMVGLGVAAPLASRMLAGAGLAHAQARPAFSPAKRGGGGHLKTLAWDAPVLLNPQIAVGLKDWNASAIFYESLVAFNPEGSMVPVLARGSPASRTAAWRRTERW